MNDNQNARFLANGGGRTTSRVLNQPGGASSITLGMAPPIPGMGPPAAATQKKKAAPPPKVAETKTEETKTEAEPSPTSVATTTTTTTDGKTTSPNSKSVSANAFASGANANGAQVMTGRPTSRVLHPGGGGGPTSWSLGG
mmetsp:Transcript_20562/g.56763  ORF Transcript_20562/g.56763 Transcript_20562/m.56763 type:complete len:141 (-) Transcript_20562:136-558(-)|eukprot:CAMPEP_0168742072 /NCGR_PEP_ID=MMETSP0724-20121128/12848_1 /TAXON_ID=265536 /ORGANISM="Amphiprora sp., Strain CCMP467" /LENGTH=140 /DNA_ID=CAMNT_0008789611 /DNA_START=91 /DNA_END=513 /DNA_ORIENTATION=+